MVYIFCMREVNLNGIDLNLLPPLEALLRHRNVTRAAEDVGMSQPAMSRALGRLRDLLGDPLLVRSGGALLPTPQAEALLPALHAALGGAKAIFERLALDPASAERTMRIAASDVQTVLIAPPLLSILAAEAPGIRLEFEGYGRDVIARMQEGRTDLAFALASSPLPPGAVSFPVASDRLALVLRRDHPLAGRDWTIGDYARVPHVTVSLMGDGTSELDAILAAHGVNRKIVMTTPHFLSALAAVGASDAVTTVSRGLAEAFADRFGLVVRDPPFEDTDMALVLVASALRAHDPLLGWITGKIRAAAHMSFGSRQSSG